MEVFNEDDIKFKHPFTMVLSGNRRTGKTHFTKILLLKNMIIPEIRTIIWFYTSQQPKVFQEIKNSLKSQRVEFIKGLPDIKDIYEQYAGTKLIVLDDLMEEATSRADVAALFTNGRHEDVSVIFLTQNLFHQGKYSRDISLSTDYMVNFKNPRDSSVITNLGKQMGITKFLQKIYEDATKEAFTHLFLDLRSDTNDALRYRSNVLGDEQIVYQRL